MRSKLDLRKIPATGARLLGFALGVTAGVGLALLFASGRRKNTRQRVTAAARRLGSTAGHTIDQARDKVTALASRAKSAVLAGQDAFRADRASREEGPEDRMPHASGAPRVVEATSVANEEAVR